MNCDECSQFKGLLRDVVLIQEPALSLSGFVGVWNERDSMFCIVSSHLRNLLPLVMIVFRASEDTINFIQNLSSPILGSFPVCDGCMASLTYITMYTTIRPRVVNLPQFHSSSYQLSSNDSKTTPMLKSAQLDIH